ncbi:MAG TPA: penicillin acylase family protein [Thermoanaerobaculia bacterium]|nr:penicillin acylase family protein [Thermoanaerobaculia bacterium]
MNRPLLALVALFVIASPVTAQDLPNGVLVKVPGMQLPGMVTREANGIPHIFALNRHDLFFLNGWMHANDRLFQMDANRRIASGTLGELLGPPALSNDVQLRTLGLRRAAEATLPVLSAQTRAALDAYSEGVNAWLGSHLLPPEYSLLEITQIPPWTDADTLAIGKLLAFSLSFDSFDTSNTVALLTCQGVGKVVGFDGTKLFFNDLWRTAPFDKAATIPDSGGLSLAVVRKRTQTDADALAGDSQWQEEAKRASEFIRPETVELLRSWLDQVRDIQALQPTFRPDQHAGSNEWAIAPKNSTSGFALIANDPHLPLVTPSTFYPISLRAGSTNVIGMGFPGVPFVIQGQNQRIAWGSTVHPMDVTDYYQETIVPDASSPSGLSSIYKGAKEAVLPIPQVFRINNIGNGVNDDLVVVPASSSIPAATLIVPRHGPIVQLDTKTGVGVSVQYTGLYPTHEVEAFMFIDDAQNMDQFKAALQFFDVGSQNFAYADIDGNIAYFTSAEMPVREDLQAGTVVGLPPYFIRNGTGGNEWMAVKNPQPNQAMPFEILPYSEMPQIVNPPNGWFVNANNDPTGNTLDNDPLNKLRPGGGIYYLSPGYDGVRAGRITQLIRQKLANGGKISPDDMRNIQADNVLLDAQFFVPYITAALKNAQGANPNLSPALAALGVNPAIAAAVGRLAKWDFSTPTGIPEGYDPTDTDGVRAAPSQTEIDNSVGATIYSVWRGQFLGNTIDVVLKQLTVPLPPQQQALTALRTLLENYAKTGGTGASGVNFFNVPGVSDAAERRDILILKSVADTLKLLASSDFALAFGGSTNMADYRWGKLHRITFNHLFNGLETPGSGVGPLPPAVPTLAGISKSGGLSTVDAATHDVRAAGVNSFMFSSGPNRRYVGEAQPDGFHGRSSLPGGVSGVPGSPFFSNLLPMWLSNSSFPVLNDTSPHIPWQ